jgi:hypothetical protein
MHNQMSHWIETQVEKFSQACITKLGSPFQVQAFSLAQFLWHKVADKKA